MSKPTKEGWYWYRLNGRHAWKPDYCYAVPRPHYVGEWGPELVPPDEKADALEYYKNNITPGGERKGG